MKITGEHYNTKITIENEHDDLNMEDMIQDMVRPLLLAMGFQPESINEYLGKE